MESWKDLKGKVVMITGASSGIGRELCLDLVKAGCSIIAAARRIDKLKSLCNHINSEVLTCYILDNDTSQEINKEENRVTWKS
ncbi:hypothetical protein MTR67_001023 [Solanum verrucosum]|uniref:Dehydrogenase/reductase SDR family member 11 n=1 Tax=Solanum verrucosum TaxID=315347 RepID=A0AAF0PMQ1_SOLVR|nr:hypothetical protein MTR67_001023 [Solanum verrucosum]